MIQPTLHVVFTDSGAGSLRQALRHAGRNDEVIAFSDDFRFGPIDPPDPTLRATWVEAELGWMGWDEVTTRSEKFWQDACSPSRQKVAWLSRRSGLEYAGFLEWLWRLGDFPCEIVDLTEVRIAWPPPLLPAPALSLGILSPDAIQSNDLYDLTKALQATERKRYLDLWHQLRVENAPLRVVAGEIMKSAPISFFDPLLMSHVTSHWQKVAKIVGLALSSQWGDHVFQTGDIFLAARVNALVESGQLEIQGESALDMRHSEVRLATSPRSRS